MSSQPSSLHLPFTPVSRDEWQQQIVNDLKGKAFESLRWAMPEGFTSEPFYTADDLEHLPLTSQQAAQTTRQPGWLTLPEVSVGEDAKTTNARLRALLSRGADGLLLRMLRMPSLGAMASVASVATTLHGIKLSDTPVWFRTDGPAAGLVANLKTVMPYQLRGGLLNDVLKRGSEARIWINEDLQDLAEATRLTLDSPLFRTLTVGSHVFHNAGATLTQELAFTFAALADLFDGLTDAGLTLEQLLHKTTLSVSVGTSYFPEIARLRALRVLWQRFITAYVPDGLQPHPGCFVHGQTSAFYNASATPYTNMIRATTEAMAAVIGGCDALTVQPYDAVFGTPDEFSERVARNVAILLKEEAHLDKTLDPAAGSYYLETLTHQLAEAAWALFLQVEDMGGLRKSVENGFVQEEIEKAYTARVEALKNDRVMVGVNRFRFDESAARTIEASDHAAGFLPDRRLSAVFE